METYRHDGHVARVAPVDAFLLRHELMGEISSGKQAAVQSDVGQPGEPFDRLLEHCSPHCGTAARRQPVRMALRLSSVFTAQACP